MDDQRKLALAAAVAGGYVLGRTRKGRFALTAATIVMGRSLEPRQLLIEGVRRLREVPQVAELGDQIKGEVFQAGRAAVMAAANRRLKSLTGLSGGNAPEPEPEPDSDSEPESKSDPDADSPDEPEPEPESTPGSRAKKSQSSRSAGASGAAPRGRTRGSRQATGTAKSAPAKKAPGKKAAPAKKAAAKKSSARPERGR